jgi:hypothetical protein
MNFDLAAVLPQIMHLGIEWAEQRAAEITALGEPLSEPQIALARRVGVAHPAYIRVLFVPRLPVPADPLLHQVAQQLGLLGPDMVGLTLGHSIYLRRGHDSLRLLSHECRHVQQFEQAGSIAAYLPKYLRQIAEFGYAAAPYEVDARAHEAEA